ncbi:DNA-directed RNA polymerase II subunit RPB2 [Bienertia sinuspersici]
MDNEYQFTTDDAWKVIQSYFDEYTLVRHQIDSFDRFILEIAEIVEKDIIELRFSPRNCPGHQYAQALYGGALTLIPKVARLRDLTYSAPLYADVTEKVIRRGHDGNVTIEERKCLEALIARKSISSLAELGECPYDQGGYFIIDGSEKVLIAQEKLRTNHVYVFSLRQPNKSAYVAVSSSLAEPQNRPLSTLYVLMLASGKYIRSRLPFIISDIPMCIVFRALGFFTDKDIVQRICYDLSDTQMIQLLYPSLLEAYEIRSQEVALEYIGKRGVTAGKAREERIKYARMILRDELLPHVEQGADKSYYFGYIINELLSCALGRRRDDDIYHLGNRRFDVAGPLMAGKDVDLGSLSSNMARIIMNGLKYSLYTGNWTQANATGTRHRVSQILNRFNFASTLSHLRRVFNKTGSKGDLANHRKLHNTHWGMLCPETPEGQACGLMKNLALMVYIISSSSTSSVFQLVKDHVTKVDAEDIPKSTKIFVNGCWVGLQRHPELLIHCLRDLKKTELNAEIGIVRDVEKELRTNTDSGRCCRPVFVVAKQKLMIKKKDVLELQQKACGWNNLIDSGYIEYVDSEEEETTLICPTIDGMMNGSYDKLDDDGLARSVNSQYIVSASAGFGYNQWQGCKIYEDKMRSVRIPQIGDKFSSRHGQKAVIGMVYTQEDLPWTVEGMTPEIVLNPHAFPNRMTIGQFMEVVVGKGAKRQIDANPFCDITVR